MSFNSELCEFPVKIRTVLMDEDEGEKEMGVKVNRT